MNSFALFGRMEWLRLAFTVLLCIPLIVVGFYLFGLLSDRITGKDTKRRNSRETESENETETGKEPGTK